MGLGLITSGEVEDVVGEGNSVVGGVVQVFHELLVELRLLLVAEVEEGEEEDRREEGWEVESGEDQGEEVAHIEVRARLRTMAFASCDHGSEQLTVFIVV